MLFHPNSTLIFFQVGRGNRGLWREEPESIPRLGGAVYLSLGGIRRRRRCSSYTLKLGHTCTFDVPNIASCEYCPRSPKDPRFASQKLELCQDPRPPKLHLRAARLLYPGCRTSMRTAQWAMMLLTATEWPTVSSPSRTDISSLSKN